MEEDLLINTTQGEVFARYKKSYTNTIVVMIHGLGGTMNSIFYREIPNLTQHSTLRFDLTGHGRSGGEIQILYFAQLEQIQEILQLFQEEKRIFIGHSKGATLAFLIAQISDKVICVAGRWNMQNQPASRFTPEELEKISTGNSIMKNFGKYTVRVTNESFEERSKMIMNQLLSGKQDIFVKILVGSLDTVIPTQDSVDIQNFFKRTQLYQLDSDHSSFTIDLVEDSILDWL
ncbi:Alpha/beta hydrolase family protein [Spironucleus salmonicida]|uniref:Alpha/beta hydrolase family protein n=1 Tax=Spironucleus salmonicida TaxID=348837 RepID=V6LYG3_9EUKA|nr:Alpha/beta hydrolase family protein [Spironucleus salmonicida]|eukprot:EST49288.1 hypothetical protein SS50377_10511 [Spironucleus salmonicida]